MNIKLTGKFASDGSKIFIGSGSKLLIELRAGDIITNGLIVESIVNNNIFIVKSNSIGICTDVELCIEQANVNYLLPNFSFNYTSQASFKSINADLLTTKTFIAGGVKVSNLFDLYQLNFDLSSTKVLEFNKDFDYYIPTVNTIVLASTIGSTALVSTMTSIGCYCTLNSTQVNIQANITSFTLSVGMHVGIDGHEYIIQSIDFSSQTTINYIVVNKPLHKSGLFYISSVPDVSTLYNAGDTILINGSMATVINATVTSIQVDYPLPATSNVVVKKPLVGTIKENTNSIKLSNNYDFDGSYAVTGCKIIIQYVSSQDSINGTSICYTEISQIARNNSPIIITTTKFKRSFKGVVILAKPSNGLYRIDNTRILSHTNISSYSSDISATALANILPSYVIADELAYHIREIYYNTIATDIALPFWKPFYLSVGVSTFSSMPKLCTLSNLLASSSVKSGYVQASSTTSLLQKYFKTFTYSIYKEAYEYRIFSKSDPICFSTLRTAASPIKFSIYFSNIKYTSNNSYLSNLYSCLYRLGLRLLGDSN